MYYCNLKTPIGKLVLVGDNNILYQVVFPTEHVAREPESQWIYSEKPFSEAIDQLGRYFEGSLKTFDLNLKLAGTEFQLLVLEALKTIPYGTTVSYGEIAKRIGRPKAVRAVGAANGRNLIPIIIPCHRVIGSNGTLVGFGGGLPLKRALLDHEIKYRY